jgi:acetylornithine/succinyldiaminopimelate/putrescine aminotransferase
VGDYLLQQLQELQSRNSALTAVRGRGLMIGVDVAIETKTMLKACQSRGLLLCRAGEQPCDFCRHWSLLDRKSTARSKYLPLH